MKKAVAVLLFVMIMCVSLMALGEEQTLSQNAAAGDVITFGHYEQDNDLDNGPEAIEWIVLDVQDGKALLLSKYGLDAKPYNNERVDVTWENCTLRSWLNGTFLNEAFTAQEQNGILTTSVDNSSSQGYWRTNGGNNTQDRIFLLSYAEANKYLDVQYWEIDGSDQNMKSRTSPTAYALQAGAGTSDDYKTADGAVTGWWWLRSPGDYQDYAASVDLDGSLNYDSVHYASGVVRPALWINLESSDL